MSEWIQVILALLTVVLFLSPLFLPVAAFAAQIFLCERRPRLLPVLPVIAGTAVFGWSPDGNEIFRVFYSLDALGVFAGSVLGGIVCAAVYWKTWLKGK